MHGVSARNPKCIHNVDEAVSFIKKVGFLPLFKNEIDGFSLEERTVAGDWWCGDVKKDPWAWRMVIAGRREIIYGKFFEKKAGFISKEWIPVFANYRRNGYDFDALYEDGKAPVKHKKIMEHFMEDNIDSEIMSNELRTMAGFGKDGEHGYEGAIASLMMQMYLCNCDFRRRINKKGEEYGWDVAVYSSVEHIYGYDYVTSEYKLDPKESMLKIKRNISGHFVEATEKNINKLIK